MCYVAAKYNDLGDVKFRVMNKAFVIAANSIRL